MRGKQNLSYLLNFSHLQKRLPESPPCLVGNGGNCHILVPQKALTIHEHLGSGLTLLSLRDLQVKHSYILCCCVEGGTYF